MNSPSLSVHTGVPTLLRSRALSTTKYPHSPTLSTYTSAVHYSEATGDYYHYSDPNRDMLHESASVRSSPSLYSRPASHVGHGQASGYSQSTMGRRMECEESECGSEVEGDALEVSHTQNRISMVSGPRLTKYADIPWEDFGEHDSASFTGSGNIGRMLRAATGRATGNSTLSTSSTIRSGPDSPTNPGDASRKGLGIFGGGRGKNLLSSSSGVSLASTQTVSTASSDERNQPVTPKLKSAQRGYTSGPRMDRADSFGGVAEHAPVFGSNRREAMFGEMKKMDTMLDPSPIPQPVSPRTLRPAATNERPLLSSGSPGFGLISLEVAQERERQKANRKTGIDHSAQIPSRSPLADKTNVGNDAPPVPPRGVKQKKSLMKLLKGDKSTPAFHLVTPALPSVPKLPTPAGPTPGEGSLRAGGSVWSDTSESNTSAVWPPRQMSPSPAKHSQKQINTTVTGGSMLGAELVRPRLELRPVSMNFSNALPASLLSDLSSSPPPLVPPLPSSTESDKTVAEMIKEQLANAKKGWMVQLFELEAQVRELKDELEETRRVKLGRCETCGCECGSEGPGGRSKISTSASAGVGQGGGDWLKPGGGSVMDRGRAKTGGARGVFGSGSLYEWE